MSSILSEEFLSKYKNKQPDWGYNGLGYFVFKRTYSRKLDNGETEEWWQTVTRCIDGAQKIGAGYSKEEAEKLFDHVFNLRCNFGGRSLWQLGTSTIDRFGANGLINCFYLSIKEPEDFCFLFENLMLGCGVGFSIRREHVHELPKVKENIEVKHECSKDADFIVPDSRQGWVELLRKALNSYLGQGSSFTYSTILVRGYGEPIKGFGGTASGPQILINGIAKICELLKQRQGKKLRSVDVLDICNIIGSVVVAGNVRRSSEIALGDADDYLFMRAKRWDLGNIPNWRSMSNNTIVADDFSYLSDGIWEGYCGNGEPYGLFNLPLSQKYGRLGEKIEDHCEGTNPCTRGDTLVLTKTGEKPISELVGQQVEVWNGYEWSTVEPKITGHNQKMIKVTLSDGNFLVCTEYHKWLVSVDEYKEVAASQAEPYFKVQTKHLKIGEIIWQPGHKWWNPLKVTGLEYVGIDENVYCFDEPKRHFGCFNRIITGQCGEISLESGESCNLAELYLNKIESQEQLIECAKLLYKTQKAIAAMPYLHKKTNDVVHRNMRLGLGVTGVCQSFHKLDWLDVCYKELRKFDEIWSKERNWPKSIKLTTIKPSGSLSLLSGATPGVHPAYAKYYIRRVRISASDKLVDICRNMGYYVEFVKNFDDTNDHSTVVVEFPCTAGEEAVLAKSMTAVDQLELVKKMQTVWSDNAVSVTAYYKPEELPHIKDWLNKNYKDNIKSVSFLLHSEHGFKQAPYEEISKERYEKLIAKVKPLKTFVAIGDEMLNVEECAGGACPIR